MVDETAVAEVLEDLRRERSELSARAAKVDKLIALIEPLEAGDELHPPAAGPGRARGMRERDVLPRPRGEGLANVVVRYLAVHKGSFTRREIFDALVQRSDPALHPGQKDPLKPVRNALLSAQKRGQVVKVNGKWQASEEERRKFDEELWAQQVEGSVPRLT